MVVTSDAMVRVGSFPTQFDEVMQRVKYKYDTRRLLIEIDDDAETGRFEIQGTVGSIAERDRLVDELQSHRCFADVDKGSISTAVGDRKDYKVVVKVECEPLPNPGKEE